MPKKIVISSKEKTIDIGSVIFTKVYGICEGMPIIIRYIQPGDELVKGQYIFLLPGNPKVKRSKLCEQVYKLSSNKAENLIEMGIELGIELFQVDETN